MDQESDIDYENQQELEQLQDKLIDQLFKDGNIPYHRLKLESNRVEYNQEHHYFFKVSQIQQGGSFGELALVAPDQTRKATVLTQSKCMFGVITRQNLIDAIMSHKRAKENQKEQFLRSIPCFTFMKRNLLFKFINTMQKSKYTRGQVVFKEGQTIESLYLVQSGDFELTRKLRKP